jgi:hypothetical protein
VAKQSPSPVPLVVVCLGMFMDALDALDASIVNVALPAIQQQLHLSQADLTWVIDACLITFDIFLLLAGRLGDPVGRKRVFLSGIVLFTTSSALAVWPKTRSAHLFTIPALARSSVVRGFLNTGMFSTWGPSLSKTCPGTRRSRPTWHSCRSHRPARMPPISPPCSRPTWCSGSVPAPGSGPVQRKLWNRSPADRAPSAPVDEVRLGRVSRGGGG